MGYPLAVSVLVLFLFFMPAPASAAARSLTLGMSGSDVTTLQDNLISLKYLDAGNSIGYFGPQTLAALQKFQCAQGIICAGSPTEGYGVFGPKTQAALQ